MADQTPSGAVLDVPSVAKELGLRFADAGQELYLVGGSVRDLVLGRSSPDLDFATSAHPDETTRILRNWAERRYLVGVRFGTVGALKDGNLLEITTFRQEVYAEEHRKPSVTFGDDVETDLARRDFTINAMALRLPDGDLVDPHGGIRHLAAKVLDTPLEPSLENIAHYEVEAGKGRLKPVYEFGENMIDEDKIEMTCTEIKVPGFKHSISLTGCDGFDDLL
jgi:poly(A) polymerase